VIHRYIEIYSDTDQYEVSKDVSSKYLLESIISSIICLPQQPISSSKHVHTATTEGISTNEAVIILLIYQNTLYTNKYYYFSLFCLTNE